MRTSLLTLPKEPGWRKRHMPVNWTEKRLKRLKLLHKEGFSATIIAGKLGPAFTKNIVLRKVHQLEEERLARAKVLAARKAAKARLLKRASKVIEAPRKAAPALRELASAVAQVKAEPIRIVAPVPPPARPTPLKGILLFDLREGHCRWPLGNDRPARLFCGARSVGTSSWCEHHQRIAFTGLGRTIQQSKVRRTERIR